MIAVESVGQAILQHRIHQFKRAHLGAIAQMRHVRGERHAFLTTCNNDLGIARGDLLHAERNGAKAGTAQLVETPGRGFLRNAGRHRGLTCRVLALTGGKDLAKDDFIHFARSHTGAGQRLGNGDRAKLMGGNCAQRAVERADRCAGSAGDDNGLAHGK